MHPQEKQARELAAYGRKGDSLLLHVSPEEVGILSMITPGGLTKNPQTGQPEAWASLVPMLSAGIGALFPQMGALWQGALAGGLTTALTGDWKRGVASGAMGYGLGSAMDGAGAAGAGSADAFAGMGFMDRMKSVYGTEAGRGAIMEGISDPKNLMPIAVGGGTLEQMESQEKWEEEVSKRLREQGGDSERHREQLNEALRAAMDPYSQVADIDYAPYPTRMQAGGTVPELRTQDMSDEEVQIFVETYQRTGDAQAARQAVLNFRQSRPQEQQGSLLEELIKARKQKVDGMAEGGQVDPIAIQRRLNGLNVAPPTDFVPGFNPEFLYFQQPSPDGPMTPPYLPPYLSSQHLYNPMINDLRPGPYFESILGGGIESLGQPRSPGGALAPSPFVPGSMPGSGSREASFLPGQSTNAFFSPPGSNAGGSGVTFGPLAEQGNTGRLGPGAFRPSNVSPINRGLPEWLRNPNLPPGMSEGSETGLAIAENAGLIGRGVSALTGVPFLNYLGDYLGSRYINNNVFQSDAGTQSGLDDAIDTYLYGTVPQSSPAENTGRMIGDTASRSGGNFSASRMVPGSGSRMNMNSGFIWGMPSAGLSGDPGQRRINLNVPQGKAAGGPVNLTTPIGPAQVDGGGIAELPMSMSAPPQEALQMVAAAIMGQVPEQQVDAVIEQFIQAYGVEAFRQIRDAVLGSGTQNEGMIRGPGGGMDDQINGMIGDQQPVAVSPGEYIVPADVVSGLGDGSSDAGSAKLDQMMSNVRLAKSGGRQPPPLARRVMPA